MGRRDILLDTEGGDLLLENGDISTGQSDSQNAQLLMLYNRGDLTQYPAVGLGIMQYLKGSLDGVFRREIQLQFASDGYKLKDYTIGQNGEIDVNFS